MRITPEDIADDVLVLLNGRRVVDYVAADSDEGWVEIVDIAQLAPLDVPEGVPGEDIFLTHATEWSPMPIKRITGEVKILRSSKA